MPEPTTRQLLNTTNSGVPQDPIPRPNATARASQGIDFLPMTGAATSNHMAGVTFQQASRAPKNSARTLSVMDTASLCQNFKQQGHKALAEFISSSDPNTRDLAHAMVADAKIKESILSDLSNISWPEILISEIIDEIIAPSQATSMSSLANIAAQIHHDLVTIDPNIQHRVCISFALALELQPDQFIQLAQNYPTLLIGLLDGPPHNYAWDQDGPFEDHCSINANSFDNINGPVDILSFILWQGQYQGRSQEEVKTLTEDILSLTLTKVTAAKDCPYRAQLSNAVASTFAYLQCDLDFNDYQITKQPDAIALNILTRSLSIPNLDIDSTNSSIKLESHFTIKCDAAFLMKLTILETAYNYNNNELLSFIVKDKLIDEPSELLMLAEASQFLFFHDKTQFHQHFKPWLSSIQLGKNTHGQHQLLYEVREISRKQQNLTQLLCFLSLDHGLKDQAIASELRILVEDLHGDQLKVLLDFINTQSYAPTHFEPLKALLTSRANDPVHNILFFLARGYPLDIQLDQSQKQELVAEITERMLVIKNAVPAHNDFYPDSFPKNIVIIETQAQLAELDSFSNNFTQNTQAMNTLNQEMTLIIIDEAHFAPQELERFNEIKEGQRLNGIPLSYQVAILSLIARDSPSSSALRSRAVQQSLDPTWTNDWQSFTPKPRSTNVDHVVEHTFALVDGDDLSPDLLAYDLMERLDGLAEPPSNAQTQIHLLLNGLEPGRLSHQSFLQCLEFQTIEYDIGYLKVEIPPQPALHLQPSPQTLPADLIYVCEHNFDYVLNASLEINNSQLQVIPGPLQLPKPVNIAIKHPLSQPNQHLLAQAQAKGQLSSIFELPDAQASAKIQDIDIQSLPPNLLPIIVRQDHQMHHLFGKLVNYAATADSIQADWQAGPVIQALQAGQDVVLLGLENNAYLTDCLASLNHSAPYIQTQAARYELANLPGRLALFNLKSAHLKDAQNQATPYSTQAVDLDYPGLHKLSKQQQTAWLNPKHRLNSRNIDSPHNSQPMAQRAHIRQALLDHLQRGHNVVLLGEPSSGKSALLRHLIKTHTNELEFFGTNAGLWNTQSFDTQVQLWANSQSEQLKVLFIDEATLLSDDQYAPFLTAFQHPSRQLVFNGQLHQLDTNHRIVGAGNFPDLPGRYFSEFLRDTCIALQVPAITAEEFLTNVINPILNQSPLMGEKSKAHWREITIALHAMKDYLQNPQDFTPRMLQHLCTYASCLEHQLLNQLGYSVDTHGLNSENPAQMHQFAQGHWLQHAQNLFANALSPSDAHLALAVLAEFKLDQTLPLPANIQGAINPMALTLKSMDNRSLSANTSVVQKIAQALEPSLWLRSIRLKNTEQKEDTDYSLGLTHFNFVCLESAPGTGKDTGVIKLLSNSIDCKLSEVIHYNASQDIQALENYINKAAEQGLVLVVSELNLIPSETLESLLNDVLTGFLPNGQGVHPGFLLIATINNSSTLGREAFSDALKSRSIYQTLDNLTLEDLLAIDTKILDTVLNTEDDYARFGFKAGFTSSDNNLLGSILPLLQSEPRKAVQVIREVNNGVATQDALKWFFPDLKYTNISVNNLLPKQSPPADKPPPLLAEHVSLCVDAFTKLKQSCGHFKSRQANGSLPFSLKVAINTQPTQPAKVEAQFATSQKFTTDTRQTLPSAQKVGEVFTLTTDSPAHLVLPNQTFNALGQPDNSLIENIKNAFENNPTVNEGDPVSTGLSTRLHTSPQQAQWDLKPGFPAYILTMANNGMPLEVSIFFKTNQHQYSIAGELDISATGTLFAAFDPQLFKSLTSTGQEFANASLILVSKFQNTHANKTYGPEALVQSLPFIDKALVKNVVRSLPTETQKYLADIAHFETKVRKLFTRDNLKDKVAQFIDHMAQSLYYAYEPDDTLDATYKAAEAQSGIHHGAHVAQTLFEQQRGRCSHTALSAAWLLQHYAGIPTRIQAGLTTQKRPPQNNGSPSADELSSQYIVNAQPHAWIQAYIYGEWHHFDPTPITRDTALFIKDAVAAFDAIPQLPEEQPKINPVPVMAVNSQAVNPQPIQSPMAIDLFSPPMSPKVPAQTQFDDIPTEAIEPATKRQKLAHNPFQQPNPMNMRTAPVKGSPHLYAQILANPDLKNQLLRTKQMSSTGFKRQGDQVDTRQLALKRDRIFKVARMAPQAIPRKLVLNNLNTQAHLLAPLETLVLQSLAEAGHQLHYLSNSDNQWRASQDISQIWQQEKAAQPAFKDKPHKLDKFQADEYLELDCTTPAYEQFILNCLGATSSLSTSSEMNWHQAVSLASLKALDSYLKSQQLQIVRDQYRTWQF